MQVPSSGLIRLALVSAALVPLLIVSPAPAQEADGMVVNVQNPISGGAVTQIKGAVDAARAVPRQNIKKVVFDFNPDGKDAATESYGDCYELAKYIRNLRDNGITPIAFVHGKVTRHTVLPALACEDLIMAGGSQIGEVSSKDRPADKAEQDYYQQLAGIGRGGAVAKMYDKDVRLVQALYNGATIYVDLRKVQAKDPAFDVRVTNPNPIPMGPGVELYGVEQAIKFGICKMQIDDLAELLRWYQITPTVSQLTGGFKACRVLVEGTIDTALRERIRRQIETAKAHKENLFFFVIETTTGGDPGAARELADDLLALVKDPNYKARAVAFVPGNAPDLAIFLAFACGDIVMYKGSDPAGEAVLGDFEAIVNAPPAQRRNPDFIQRNLEEVAEKAGQSKLLVRGLFDKNLEIVQARNNKTGDRQLMSGAELQAQPDKAWVSESVIKPKGVLLKLNASKAKNLRVAKTVDNKDVSEVYALYGVEAKDVREAEPGWLDELATFLRRPAVSILLVIIGIAGLILELKAPGLVVPGVIAAVCFVLFFWSQTQLGGQLIYLAIMLFLLGLALVGIEIFLIPGFGVTGVSGILLILAGLVLAGLDRAPESTSDWVDLIGRLLRYGLTMAGAGVLAFLLSRYLPKIPYANRLMLVPPEDKPEADEASPLPGVEAAVSMLGQVGTATSMLRPAGLARFGDRYVDVVTEGDFVEPGTPIQVIEVEGTRIVVKKV
jgi:membrane-bound serine protease (ClpP class)